MNSEKNSKGRRVRKPLFYNFCYDFVKVTGALPTLLWLRPRVYRPYGTRTPRGGVLVSANHSTFIDPIIMHLAFPTRRMYSLATKDLFNTRAKEAFFKQMHCIMVDKDNFAISSFRDVVSRLEDGRMVVIFPEGSVDLRASESVRAFKSGAVLMAYKASAPILPVYIVRRERWYQRQRIVIGEPFDVRAAVGDMPTLDQLNAASEELRRREIALSEYFKSLPISRRLRKSKNKTVPKEEEKYEQQV